MTTDSEKTFRWWVAWPIGSVWAGTVIAVVIATWIHPATTADLAVTTRKITFKTNASHILGQSNEEQLLISGLNSLRIGFSGIQTVVAGGKSMQLTSLEADGDSFSSCSLYMVRSGGFEVRGPAVITLETLNPSRARSFSLRAHGDLIDSLSSLAGEHGLHAGFECRGLHLHGGPAIDVEGPFSPHGGDSIFLATAPDARLDFLLVEPADVGDTQIPILSEVRFSEITPGTSEEKSVLLQPAPEITFEEIGKKLTTNVANLLLVVPKNSFYLRKFMLKDGIQLSLHGSVRDLRAGAGASDMATLMPSAFEHLSNSMRAYGAIPAIAGLILGIMERMGALGRK
jgi:hypothetical protein